VARIPRLEAGARSWAGTGSGAKDLHHTKENCPHMARLSGVDLPRDKRLEVALTYIYGIGHTRALQTIAATGVSADTRVHSLSDDDLLKLRDWIDANYQVEGDLRREVQADIRRKIEIGSYQGIRHRRGLPVHGQRTQTNARTRKGKKKTVAGKKKAGKK
jgi:small subunit ribosomal protein S13